MKSVNIEFSKGDGDRWLCSQRVSRVEVDGEEGSHGATRLEIEIPSEGPVTVNGFLVEELRITTESK